MPQMNLDQFLRRVNEISTGSIIHVIDVADPKQPVLKEILDVSIQYDTKKTDIFVKIK